MDQPNVERSGRDPATVAREIIDANLYMTLATADGDGRPWATLGLVRPRRLHRPVLGVATRRPPLTQPGRPSGGGHRHLRLHRPEGNGQAVYVEALAGELDEAEREEGIAVVSRRSEAHGAAPWGVADVTGPAPLRLYRARASAHFVLAADDRRLTVRLG
jgi:hypothetical protein